MLQSERRFSRLFARLFERPVMRAAAVCVASLVTLSCVVARPLAAQSETPGAPVPMPPHAMSWGTASYVLSEVLEFAPQAIERPVLFDLVSWTGGSVHRLWLKADGSAATVGRATHGEYQALYGRLVSPFWDAQFGLRADVRSSAGGSTTRVGGVVGLQGLAPGWFELEPSLFVTTTGNLSLDLTGSIDLYLTQRLVMQPRLETSLALRDDPDFGIGRGLSGASFGLRVRYEVRREFAPYLGVVLERDFGRTAELARLAGGEKVDAQLVLGLRFWR